MIKRRLLLKSTFIDLVIPYRLCTAMLFLLAIPLVGHIGYTFANDNELPIADAHVHYSHDSVDLTPPERVIEIMREANLKFALVSSSDDNGTQLLSDLAPDLIIPGLRPYRRRGELSSWFTDQGALDYVEQLLKKNVYASIGEFHLYGDSVELPIPRRIVELADQYNLVLHAHSDADAVERLLAQSDTVKVIWAHAGFDSPSDISAMLSKHDRLWADLAFRSEVGQGGTLSKEWRTLFETHPDRMMLGSDTYTPERMYFIPDHAASSRVWLATLAPEVAENVAWKNAFDLLMPIWQANRAHHKTQGTSDQHSAGCGEDVRKNVVVFKGDQFKVLVEPLDTIEVSKPLSLQVTVCGETSDNTALEFDADMPAHGHGMNYEPTVSQLDGDDDLSFRVDGVVLHMPGTWRWTINVEGDKQKEKISQKVDVR